MNVSQLPAPQLAAHKLDALHILTDDALARTAGVRVAFTGRAGGVSTGSYAGLDLATHVGDDPAAVAENRRLLMDALGATGMPLVVPNQVHGSDLVTVSAARVAADAAARAAAGADGIIVTCENVAALLCFADCVPVIVVSPSGSFAVVHAGWRGVMASIVPKAVRALAARESEGPGALFGSAAEAAASYNVYLGPYIHAECFETGADVRDRFLDKFGTACIADDSHVDLGRALVEDLVGAGVEERRIADAGVCTVCHADEFFSYRASGGVCGRHGAVAFRKVEG